ncbi:hemolysin family protein [Coprobacter tertius]|uniref:Hemolysin family protein n=1 Tax=Coprobacter tertius TaxID=2944915 RepID=A0ABT1MGX8_9BACT|nr:hemolysin family protein [Coprobacter tertius]MCP9611111.1 hemolysin family protein [Coprobacter tertius]
MSLLIWTIIVSLLFSAFFSGMEIAFVSSNKVRFEIDMKKSTLLGRALNVFYRHQEQFISTMLVGNNIALVIYGIGMAQVLEPLLAGIFNNEIFVVLGQTLLSTLLILLTAEFLPKTLFRINPNSVMRVFALPAYLFYIILYPVSKLTAVLSKGVLWLGGVKISKDRDGSLMSKVDLDYFIQQSIEDADDENEVETEVKIFQNALDFSNLKLRDCMIPRNEVVAVDIDSTTADGLISEFIETGLSKILVYRDNIDNVIGYIHSSEMFKKSDNWRIKIKPILQVPETMPAKNLMKMLMQQKKSIAVVIDEFGGTGGVVTLEDLVEEIFGDIEDEHDVRNYVLQKVSDTEYIFSGRLEIEKINEKYDIELPESDDYMTIAGFILWYVKTIPQQGETVEIPPFKFKILKRNATKIELVRMKIEK